MHSIHVDRGIHTIFPGMIAAAHDDLQPPLPLLSLSSGYLTWTKGSAMPPPIFFFGIAHNWNDALDLCPTYTPALRHFRPNG